MTSKVKLVFRKPFDSSFSIEYLFYAICKDLQKEISIRTYTLPFYSKGFFKRMGNCLSLTFSRDSIVHITGDVYYVVLGAWFSKRIITVHDLSFLHRTSGIRHLILKWFWVTLPCRFAHKITVISGATGEDLLRFVKLPETKIAIIYDFIDELFKPVKKVFNKEKPTILQIGCAPNKNLGRLIEAIRGLECRLVIVGKLSAEQLFLLHENKIQYQNKYDISMDELYEQYKLADLLCYVSTIEGFGMPLLEAQATGLPVITSNCSSMPEIAGTGALFVDPLSIDSIRKGILELINDHELRTRNVLNGFQNVLRFSKEKIAQEYLRVYKQLAVLK
jgi:glycosyltransferase involved in cell wall biosynthesis